MIILKTLGILYLISVVLLAVIMYFGYRHSEKVRTKMTDFCNEYGKLYYNLTLLCVILVYPVAIVISKLDKMNNEMQ